MCTLFYHLELHVGYLIHSIVFLFYFHRSSKSQIPCLAAKNLANKTDSDSDFLRTQQPQAVHYWDTFQCNVPKVDAEQKTFQHCTHCLEYDPRRQQLISHDASKLIRIDLNSKSILAWHDNC